MAGRLKKGRLSKSERERRARASERAKSQPRIGGRFVSEATAARYARAQKQPRVNGKFATAAQHAAHREAEERRHLPPEATRSIRETARAGRLLNFEYRFPRVALEDLPPIAARIVFQYLRGYASRPAVIHAYVYQYDTDETTERHMLVREGWMALAATAKLEASLNNLEAEIDALQANVNYANWFRTDAVRFQIWL